MARRIAVTIPPTTRIDNYFSSGGSSSIQIPTYGITVTSGVGTGGTLATLLSVTGSGWVPYLACYSNSATPTHTVRCQVIVDGLIVFDATSGTIASSPFKYGMYVVDSGGMNNTSTVHARGYPIRYNSSFVVNVASSQSGTDYVAIGYELHRT